jgi:hypothetical protein
MTAFQKFDPQAFLERDVSELKLSQLSQLSQGCPFKMKIARQ